MKKITIILFLLLSVQLVAQQITNLKVINHHYFNNLPSASGVEIYQNKMYLVADDLPWLFEMNFEGDILHKFQVSGITKIENGRTPKNIKADFESMAIVQQNGRDCFLILSSGSKKDKRDTAYLFSPESKKVVAKKNLRPWYRSIKEKSGMGNDDEINIEGTAIVDDKIYVAHRGNVSGNFIAASSLKDFLNYLSGKTSTLPVVEVFTFKLPSHDGVSAGLSGLSGVPGNDGLLVTASLEATGDVLNDGAVLGSYLGYIPVKTMDDGKIYLTPITDDDNKMIAKKQEGITLISTTKQGHYRVLTVCDNDDGTSDTWQFSFQINEVK